MESILTSVKKMLGIDENYTAFDADLIIHINTVLSILTDFGIGPSAGFAITGDTEKWTDFLEGDPNSERIKTYVFLKTRLIFDPPLNSSTIEVMNRAISELEWRIYVEENYTQAEV